MTPSRTSHNPEEALNWMINPYTREDFLRYYWGKMPLHIPRKDSARYKKLFNSNQFELLLGSRVHSSRLVRIVADGKTFSPDDYCKDHKLSDSLHLRECLDIHKIRQLFGEGATIILQHLELFDPQVSKLCAQLTGAFHHRVEAHAFLTPPTQLNRGLPPHTDPIDSFVIQLEGTRRWETCEPLKPPPFSHERKKSISNNISGSHDLILSPGDSLFIPMTCPY